MKIKLLIPMLSLLAMGSCGGVEPQAPAMECVVWNLENIDSKSTAIAEGAHDESYEALIKLADGFLVQDNPSVMEKPQVPEGQDMHDYMSLARYYWADPNSPDGMPYIRRDGESTPELNLYDRNRLGEMTEYVNTLSLVYYVSGEQKYADKAISMLRTWFIDPATRMNPNFDYSQVRKGHNDNKGNVAGLIDGYSFIEMLDAVMLLDIKGALPKSDAEALSEWFAEFSQWYMTSENGIQEYETTNNHGIAYDAQLIRYLIYGGRYGEATKRLNHLYKHRIVSQIASDGSQPEELERTVAFHYSVYNLEHVIDICGMARVMGIDLYNAGDGEIDLALRYLMPYAEDPDSFPYKQINNWSVAIGNYARLLYRASYFANQEEYQAAYKRIGSGDELALFEFIYQ